MKTLRFILLVALMLLIAPSVTAQMPPRNPAWVQINPPFEGMETGYTSATVEAFNYYGNYWWDVLPGVVVGAPHNILSVTHADTVPAALVAGDILYVDATPDLTRLPVGNPGDVISLVAGFPVWVAPGAVGVLWEAGVSYRGGAASLEPIAAQDGIPILAQDVTANWYSALMHDGVDNIHDSNTGDHQFFTTGGGARLEVYAPGQVPGGASTHFVYAQHDDTDGEIGTEFGSIGIRPGGGGMVGIFDNAIGGDDYYFQNGDGLANQALFTDGANNVTFQYEHSKTAFQTCHYEMAINNFLTQLNPAFLLVDTLPTSNVQGIMQCRDGSVTGISITCQGVVENPATLDQIRFEVYLNGVSTGLGVNIDAGTSDASAVQAVLTDQFVAGDELTIAAWYIAGGVASTITATSVIGVIEVHYD